MPTFRILVASYSSSIYTIEFSTDPLALKLVSSVEVGFHPSWIEPLPSDGSTIFTALEAKVGKVVELKYDDAGQGTVIASTESGGDSPCTFLIVGQEILAGNYMEGNVVSIPLASSPPFISEASPSTTLQLHGSGPDTSRQKSSHPHQVYKVPGQEEVLVPDLGADKTWRLVRGKDGWRIAGCVEYEAGSGPRHVIVYDNKLYTVLELQNNISVHTFLPLSSSARPSQLATLPIHIPTSAPSADPLPNVSYPYKFAVPAGMLAAEILFSSSPSPYLYVSNRNDPTSGGDTIAIFVLSSSSSPERVGEVKTGLHHLRGMILFGDEDKYLIAGGVNGGEGGVGVRVFERVEGGKWLNEVAGLRSLGEVEGEGEGLVRGPTGFLVLSVKQS